jgi:hypothetical protein
MSLLGSAINAADLAGFRGKTKTSCQAQEVDGEHPNGARLR